MKRSKSKRFLLVHSWIEYQKYLGILTYAHNANWTLQAVNWKSLPLLHHNNFAGIISQLHPNEHQLVEFVKQADCPKVELCDFIDDSALIQVPAEYDAIGAAVADHFLERHFTSFMFFGFYTERRHSNLYYDGFRARLATKGFSTECIWLTDNPRHTEPNFLRGYHKPNIPPQKYYSTLMRFLRAASKPLALFVENPLDALDVLSCCHTLQLSVPAHVAIVCLSEPEMICALTEIPLSSISNSSVYFRQGYRAAEMLDRMISGRSLPLPETIDAPLAEQVVTRASSNVLAVDNDAIAQLIAYIMNNLDNPDLYVPTLVRQSGISRSTLYSLFVKHTGLSLAAFIRRQRLLRAKTLLATTDKKIQTVANLCGFSSARNLRRALKQDTTLTPRAYQASSALT